MTLLRKSRTAWRHRGLSALGASLIAASPAWGIELPQADGSTLVLDQPARRIVTLSPHLAELVYDAGAGGHLLATVEYSNFPPPAASLPRVGDAFRIDLERILALEPDLVLAWDSGNPRPAIARLQSLGLRTWIIEIRSPDEIAEVLDAIGAATGMPEPAAAAAGRARRKLAAIATEFAGRSEVRYFYQVDARPLFTINGEHLIARGLALCGGRNVFADAGSLAPQVTREAVIAANPEVLFAPAVEAGSDPLAQWAEWPAIRAVGQGALYTLPADEISRATSRLLDAIARGCRLMHGSRGEVLNE